jgi:hypothetical protein
MTLCCRRVRGSFGGGRLPWAYAHGYLLPPAPRAENDVTQTVDFLVRAMPVCCRRVRGSFFWGVRLPWAYAPAYLLPPAPRAGNDVIQTVDFLVRATCLFAVAAFAASLILVCPYPGLTPSATCYRPLRGLGTTSFKPSISWYGLCLFAVAAFAASLGLVCRLPWAHAEDGDREL